MKLRQAKKIVKNLTVSHPATMKKIVRALKLTSIYKLSTRMKAIRKGGTYANVN